MTLDEDDGEDSWNGRDADDVTGKSDGNAHDGHVAGECGGEDDGDYYLDHDHDHDDDDEG